MNMIYKFLLLSSLAFYCCGPSAKDSKSLQSSVGVQQSDSVNNVSEELDRMYNFIVPTETFVLDSKLGEISGLSYNDGDVSFLCNNDEKGYFYILDGKTFEIKSEQKFAKGGDFESIEKVRNEVVVCKSSGKLYRYNLDNGEVITDKTGLSSSNNVEGLCFLESEDMLLIACKEEPLENIKGKKNEKCFYTYDLKSKSLNKEPYLTIGEKELIEKVKELYSEKFNLKLSQFLNKVDEFAPSGIAVHPQNQDLYIISARESILLIVNKNKEIKDVLFLNNKTIPQPEGITFDPEGNLYISTEGQGFSGKVFKFDKLH